MITRNFYSALPSAERADTLQRFVGKLESRAEDLIRLSAQCTKTPIKHHTEDLGHTIEALEVLLSEHPSPLDCVWRPKGKVLLGLSANEPLIVGIVPLAAALLADNHVAVRPASTNRLFEEIIVSMLTESGISSDALTLLPPERHHIEETLLQCDHVVWFGSTQTCSVVGRLALDYNINYILDAEGYDLAVFAQDVSMLDLEKYTTWVVNSIARHDGQTCQAIRGILIHDDQADAVLEALISATQRLKIGPFDETTTDCTIPPKIDQINAVDFPAQAPFQAQAWVYKYGSENELSKILSRNPYGLSVVLFTEGSRSSVYESPVKFARVGRVVINTDPGQVNPAQPWGAYRKSGSSGPEYWLAKFADRVVIRGGV